MPVFIIGPSQNIFLWRGVLLSSSPTSKSLNLTIAAFCLLYNPYIKFFLFTERVVIFSLLGGTSSILRTFLVETSEKSALYFAVDLEEEELLE